MLMESKIKKIIIKLDYNMNNLIKIIKLQRFIYLL